MNENNKLLIGGYYSHYKNKLYKVLDIAKHSEDLEDYVVYKSLYDNKLAKTWIRPYKMFIENVGETPRFRMMTPTEWPIQFSVFHSHIYFDQTTMEKAEKFHALFKQLNLRLQISPVHKMLMGPHPHWMFEVDFHQQNFMEVVEFMIKNRDGLNILIHPLSGHALLDHTDYAMFLGEKLDLNLSIF